MTGGAVSISVKEHCRGPARGHACKNRYSNGVLTPDLGGSMRNRQKQRALFKAQREAEANKDINWRRNAEGYADPTFYAAMKNDDRERNKENG